MADSLSYYLSIYLEVFMEEKELTDEIITEIIPKKPRKDVFKTKECKVISYNRNTKNLDICFDGNGIRIHDVQDFNGDIVKLKYKGDIGKSNFLYKL